MDKKYVIQDMTGSFFRNGKYFTMCYEGLLIDCLVSNCVARSHPLRSLKPMISAFCNISEQNFANYILHVRLKFIPNSR